MSLSRRIGVVINPIKFDDLADVKDGIAKVCADHGWGEPAVETTEEDPASVRRGRPSSAAWTSSARSAATAPCARSRPP